MIIDAGQKKIGAQHCSTCDFLFSDDPSEQKAHNIRHARALGHIDFKGWKKEYKIDCPDLDGRVVMVRYRDGKAHWDKVSHYCIILFLWRDKCSSKEPSLTDN